MNSFCIKLLDNFVYKGHTCMTFPALHKSLYDYMKSRQFVPLSLYAIQEYSRQILSGIAYIHSRGVIHTDIKPENIMLENDTDYRVVIIDFGSAVFKDGFHPPVVSTRHYRAPEVLLELGWSYSIDLVKLLLLILMKYSLGCMLAELRTGEALFQTHEKYVPFSQI